MCSPSESNKRLPLRHFINILKILVQIHLIEILVEIEVQVLVTLAIIILTLNLLILAFVHTLTIEITNNLLKIITIPTIITTTLLK